METSPTVAEMMIAYAEDAVAHARQSSGVSLDYSAESIGQVEQLLGAMYSAIPRGFIARLFKKGPAPEALWALCKMYGGYVGEVVRRAKGGAWTLDTDIVPGESTICLTLGKGRIWPPSKIYKRLTNGEEDNVRHYFLVVMKTWAQ